ncbi:hypothetical protein P4U43_14915 [Arthrobacter sp. EH-1B-1]|uniref:Uncharacterized protein n=1 Tax=Arthrobacter vasquezii TaxID=2977629 RepID=A0ABT6CYA5_9MICC|nr:hypothetical protein [Arthrobacter vasquezii]MDF9279078.1 hypothetical protein [Arthrobacter vasquezii]
MNAPSARVRKIAALSAGPIAVLLAGGMVWQGSQAAFTATTRNAGNAWSTGTVMLTDDDAGRAAFTAEGIVPGDSGEKCIVVTSGSNVAGEVRAYTQNLSPSAAGLENHIIFDVEQGTGGSFNDCTGFAPTPDTQPGAPISALAQMNNNYLNGGSAWTTTGNPGESQVYRGSWKFDTTGLSQQQIDALQGSRISIDLVWELQTEETPTP